MKNAFTYFSIHLRNHEQIFYIEYAKAMQIRLKKDALVLKKSSATFQPNISISRMKHKHLF